MGCRRLAIFAILMGTVFAETNAGATTLASEQGSNGTGHVIGRGICLPAGTLSKALETDLSDGPPPLIILESTMTWPGASGPSSGVLDSLGAPDGVASAFNVPASAPMPEHTGTAPEPDEVNYRAKGPTLQSADLLSWKSTGDTPPANPEDWLFRLQYTKASSYQVPDPNPPFPIPEPATGVLVLMGVAGAIVRRWRT